VRVGVARTSTIASPSRDRYQIPSSVAPPSSDARRLARERLTLTLLERRRVPEPSRRGRLTADASGLDRRVH
jgi:hypothetical protein